MDNRGKQEIYQQICNLREQLSSSVSDIGDWKVAKCYEYSLAGKEMPYDIQKLMKERQAVRDKINTLMLQLDTEE